MTIPAGECGFLFASHVAWLRTATRPAPRAPGASCTKAPVRMPHCVRLPGRAAARGSRALHRGAAVSTAQGRASAPGSRNARATRHSRPPGRESVRGTMASRAHQMQPALIQEICAMPGNGVRGRRLAFQGASASIHSLAAARHACHAGPAEQSSQSPFHGFPVRVSHAAGLRGLLDAQAAVGVCLVRHAAVPRLRWAAPWPGRPHQLRAVCADGRLERCPNRCHEGAARSGEGGGPRASSLPASAARPGGWAPAPALTRAPRACPHMRGACPAVVRSQVGGNQALQDFFRRQGIIDEPIANKYNSAAAAWYRERIRCLRQGDPAPSESTIKDFEAAAMWHPGDAAPSSAPPRRVGLGAGAPSGIGSSAPSRPTRDSRADSDDALAQT